MSKKPAEVRARAIAIFAMRKADPNITQKEIAARVGISRASVAKYETGHIKNAPNLFRR